MRTSLRRGSALVAVMVAVLVVGGLASLLMLRGRTTRRRFQAVERTLQRELVLDAALTHAFHLLKEVMVDSSRPLAEEPVPPGAGNLEGTPYEFRFRTAPDGKSVRIDAKTGGEGPSLEGFAVAIWSTQEDTEARLVRQAWALVYYGPEPSEKESP